MSRKPVDNNSNNNQRLSVIRNGKDARLAAFENRRIASRSGNSDTLAVEDTAFIVKILKDRGCVVDDAKWDDNTLPYTFVLNYLNRLFNGDEIQAILLDYDLGRGDELTGATIAGWIREAEAALGLQPVLIVANSSDEAGNQAIVEAVEAVAEATPVMSCNGNKLAFFMGQAQPVQPSKAGFFGSQAAGHDVQAAHHKHSRTVSL